MTGFGTIIADVYGHQWSVTIYSPSDIRMERFCDDDLLGTKCTGSRIEIKEDGTAQHVIRLKRRKKVTK